MSTEVVCIQRISQEQITEASTPIQTVSWNPARLTIRFETLFSIVRLNEVKTTMQKLHM